MLRTAPALVDGSVRADVDRPPRCQLRGDALMTIDRARLAAIDVHVHLEHDRRGDRRRARGRRSTSARAGRRASAQALADYYRSRNMACVVFTVDETLTGRAAPDQRRGPRVRGEERRHRDRRSPASTRRAAPRRVREARRLVATGAVRGLKLHPPIQQFLPNDRARLSALRSLRRSEAAGALPHRAQRHRHRHARRRRHPAEVRQPDAHRRCGGGFSGHADHHGASVVPVAGRGDLGLPAQAAGLHRSVRAGRRSTSRRRWCSTRTRC